MPVRFDRELAYALPSLVQPRQMQRRYYTDHSRPGTILRTRVGTLVCTLDTHETEGAAKVVCSSWVVFEVGLLLDDDG